MIHKLVTQWAGEASIKQLCLALGVSRSGYYAARARQAQPKALCHDSLHIKAAFAASGNTYGSRRLQAAESTAITPVLRAAVPSSIG